MKFLQ
jgi:hypothetical protein